MASMTSYMLLLFSGEKRVVRILANYKMCPIYRGQLLLTSHQGYPVGSEFSDLFISDFTYFYDRET